MSTMVISTGNRRFLSNACNRKRSKFFRLHANTISHTATSFQELATDDVGNDTGSDGGSSTSSGNNRRQKSKRPVRLTLLERLKKAGIPVPIQRKVVAVNFDLTPRWYWHGDENCSAEEIENFAMMKPKFLYRNIVEPKHTGYLPNATGNNNDNNNTFRKTNSKGQRDETPSSSSNTSASPEWRKWNLSTNAEEMNEFGEPLSGKHTDRYHRSEPFFSEEFKEDNSDGSGNDEDPSAMGRDDDSDFVKSPRMREKLLADAMQRTTRADQMQYEQTAQDIDGYIRWSHVDDESGFGFFMPDTFKQDLYQLYTQHDFTIPELATVYSISQARTRAIIRLKELEAVQLPLLIEEHNNPTRREGLLEWMKKENGQKKSDGEDTAEDTADNDVGEVEENALPKAASLDEPLTGEEIENELTKLYYDNPF
eukprot:g13.t1